jgi:hypothetical protein
VNPTGSVTALRPLGIGEILDRAVNLCVRHFSTLGLIYIVFVIPLSVIQFYASQDFNTYFQALQELTKNGNSSNSAEVFQRLGAAAPSANGWTIFLYIVIQCIGPLPGAALISAVAAVYIGQPTSFGIAYRLGLTRWGQLLGVGLMYLFTGGFIYIVAVVAIVLVFFAIGLIYSVQSTAGIVLGIVVGLILLLAVLGFAVLAVLAGQISAVTCVVEGVNFVAAFLSGLKRIFTSIGVRRALPFGLAYVAILFGIGIVAGAGQIILSGLLHSVALGVAYSAVITIFSTAFSTAFIVIFYYDLRVREEGLDLQMLAARERAEPLPSP